MLGATTVFENIPVVRLFSLLNIRLPETTVAGLTLSKLLMSNSPLLLMLSCVNLDGSSDELLPVWCRPGCVRLDCLAAVNRLHRAPCP